MEAYLIATFLVAAGLAFIPASIAKNKGYSFGLWWFYGWMLIIVAFIHVILIPDKRSKQTSISPSSQNPSNNEGSTADELEKYKELMNQDVITEEEFRAKKEQLLKSSVVKKTLIADGNLNIDLFLKRVFMFLEDKEWNSADGYCEKILDINPECAEAYLGKLMVSLKVPLRQELKNCSTIFDNEINFQKAMRFADDNLKKELQGYIDYIVSRNKKGTYDDVIKTMDSANSETEYKNDDVMKIKNRDEYKRILGDIEADGEYINETQQEPLEISKDSLIIDELPAEVLSRPVTDLRITTRVVNVFVKMGIKTIADVVVLDPDEIRRMDNIGSGSYKQLMSEIKLLRQQGADYFNDDKMIFRQNESKYSLRELDINVAKKLMDEYGLKTKQLCEWYNLSRQSIYNKLDKRINHGNWCGKELLSSECLVITTMINNKCYYHEENDTKFYLFNNAKDDCAFVIVTKDDIKCFFLADLPGELQDRIKSNRLNILTENEVKAIPTLGREVFILKKKYFMPESSTFTSLANHRSMSVAQYSQFLFGLPYCNPSTSVTDDRIIKFFKENTVNGKTSIPLASDNQWIRAFISRNGYTTKDFIEFYEFSVTSDDENVDFDFTADDNNDENDMQIYPKQEGFVENLFAENPLLGSKLISKDNLDEIYSNSKIYISQLLRGSKVENILKAEMKITLSIINFAKNWDAEKETSFWKYIATQFGYRDDSGKLRELLCRCIKNSLVGNKRWFISNSSGNQYKSSIMVHAFSTKQSWLYFCDFLFEFYKTNLDWQYIENDPMFARMVYALKNRFENTEEAYEDIKISKRVYNFREGIIKLIIYRPKYATQLISKLIKRINALINHSDKPASCYEEQLCDEWMANKLQEKTLTKNKGRTGERRKIAIDYTKIRPVYQLINERDINIVFPDVRLKKNDFSSLQLKIYHNGKMVEQRNLSFYGNELGKTMSGFSIGLEDYLRKAGTGTIEPHIIITCDNEEIYNSCENLYRKMLVFRDKSEVDVGSCRIGDYSFFIPRNSIIDISKADRSLISETSFLKGEYISLQKNFTINLNGELVSLDNNQSSELQVIGPNISNSVEYVFDGIRYSVVTGKETIHIISSDRECEKKYRLTANDEIIILANLPYEDKGQKRIYKLVLSEFEKDELSLKMMNFDKNHLELCHFYKIVPSLDYKFNKTCFFEPKDFYDAKLKIKIGSEAVSEFPVSEGEQILMIPYQSGYIEVPVPVVSFIDNTNTYWNSERTLWMKDIPQERFIYAKVPSGIKAELFLDDILVGTEKANTFAIGNAIVGFSNSNNKSWLRVYAIISDGESTKKYCIGKIAVKEQFVQIPILKFNDNTLTWNRGYGFIGDSSGAFKISVCCDTEFEQTIPLDLQSEIISSSISLPLGEFKFKIVKESGNLFAMKLQEIVNGSFIVGDENEVRFLRHIIKIDAITFENDQRYDLMKINACYIDQIEYKGIQDVQSEDRECPIYMGILYYITKRGKRYDFSFNDIVDGKGHELYKVNPVKIIFINDRTLSITNEDGDGLYFYEFEDYFIGDVIYQLTDREPTNYNKHKYYSADLFSYIRKDVK